MFYINGLSEEKSYRYKISLDITKCSYKGFDRTGLWTQKLKESGGKIMGDKVSIMMDSGAPSFYNKYVRQRHDGKSSHMGSHMKDRKYDDFSFLTSKLYLDYRRKYVLFIKEHLPIIDVYANLDVVNNAEATWENQQYMEARGLKPFPVWHFGTDVKWLKMYLEKGYDYIAIGGIVPNPPSIVTPVLDEIWSDLLTDENGMPLVKVHGFAVTTLALITRWPWYCMTDKHTILTKRGFLKKEEIKVGDFVLTNTGEGTSEWKPILKVHEYDVKDVTIRKYSGRFTSETTLNHKWLIQKTLKKGTFTYFDETQNFQHHSKIPRCANYLNFPNKKTHSDEIVKLIAWVLTDGSTGIDKYGRAKSVIYQSISKHPQYVKEIRNLLEKEGTWSESKEKVELSGSSTIVFYISGETRKKIAEIVGYPKKLSLDFIFSLTKQQLEMFVKECLKGDGGYDSKIKRGDPTIVFPQKQGSFLEAFKLACILLGKPISSYSPKNNIHKMETVLTSNVLTHTPSSCKYEDIQYSGKIWCIEVENNTFFTRCGGSYYWTGNSVDSASWVKYGKYGVVCIPQWKGKQWNYLKPPFKVTVSERSPSKEEIGGVHINSYPPYVTEHIKNYWKENGWSLGKSEFRWEDEGYKPAPDEAIATRDKENKRVEIELRVENGLCNDYKLRDEVNIKYYLGIEKALPEWPWAFKLDKRRKKGFFEI